MTYQTPNTQFVRLSSGEVLQTDDMGLSISSGGGNQGGAMAPRIEKMP